MFKILKLKCKKDKYFQFVYIFMHLHKHRDPPISNRIPIIAAWFNLFICTSSHVSLIASNPISSRLYMLEIRTRCGPDVSRFSRNHVFRSLFLCTPPPIFQKNIGVKSVRPKIPFNRVRNAKSAIADKLCVGAFATL